MSFPRASVREATLVTGAGLGSNSPFPLISHLHLSSDGRDSGFPSAMAHGGDVSEQSCGIFLAL